MIITPLVPPPDTWLLQLAWTMAGWTTGLAGILLPICGIGLALSLVGLLISRTTEHRDWAHPAQTGLVVCLIGGLVVYVAVAVSHYAAGFCL